MFRSNNCQSQQYKNLSGPQCSWSDGQYAKSSTILLLLKEKICDWKHCSRIPGRAVISAITQGLLAHLEDE